MALTFRAFKPFIRFGLLNDWLNIQLARLAAHEGRIRALSLVIVVTRVIPKSGVILPHSLFRMTPWLNEEHLAQS